MNTTRALVLVPDRLAVNKTVNCGGKRQHVLPSANCCDDSLLLRRPLRRRFPHLEPATAHAPTFSFIFAAPLRTGGGGGLNHKPRAPPSFWMLNFITEIFHPYHQPLQVSFLFEILFPFPAAPAVFSLLLFLVAWPAGQFFVRPIFWCGRA